MELIRSDTSKVWRAVILLFVCFAIVLSGVKEARAEINLTYTGDGVHTYTGPYDCMKHHETGVYYKDEKNFEALRIIVFQEFKSWGMTTNGACAVVGNWAAESRLDPTRLESDISWNNFQYGVTGFGLMGWTHWSLQEGIFNTAAERGVSWTDLRLQLDYAKSDFGPGGNRGQFLYDPNMSLEDCAYKFCFEVERPNSEYAHYDRRLQYAQECMSECGNLPAKEYSGGDIYAVAAESQINRGNGTVTIPQGAFVAESDLPGMPKGVDYDAVTLSLASRENMRVDQIYSMQSVKDDLTMKKQVATENNVRLFMVTAGLLFIVLAVVLFGAIVFDKVNTVLDISAVEIMTFGLVKHQKVVDKNDKSIKSNTAKLFAACAIIAVVGMLIASGGVLKATHVVVSFMTNLFN